MTSQATDRGAEVVGVFIWRISDAPREVKAMGRLPNAFVRASEEVVEDHRAKVPDVLLTTSRQLG